MRAMMKLKLWITGGKGRAASLAAHLHVPLSFVYKMANGDKGIPTDHMAAIEVFTSGAVTRQEMCPDPEKLAYHWPELAGYQQPQPAAHPQPAHAAGVSNEVA